MPVEKQGVETPTEDVSTSSLQDFNWDDTEDFFGIKAEEAKEVKTTTVVSDDDAGEPNLADEAEDTEDKPKSDKPKKETEKEEDKEVTFFEVEKPTDEGEGKGKSTEVKPGAEDSEEEDSKFYSTLATELKEKGIFQNVELIEGEEIDEEKFFELQDAEIESRVEETFEAFFEEMDEDAKAFLKFKKNGGNTQDFFQVYKNSISIDNVNLEKERDQDLVLKHYLSVVDSMDEEEVTDRLEWLKENGKKKAFAEKYFNKLKEIDNKNRQMIQQSQEQISRDRENSAKKFNQELQSELEKTESVGSFSFNKVDKKELINYVSKPTVKIGKNKFITQFQAELGNIFKAAEGEDRKKFLLLAKLVKSDFDVKDLIEATKTKVVKDAKSKLQQAKQGVKPSTSGGYTKKSITDYF